MWRAALALAVAGGGCTPEVPVSHPQIVALEPVQREPECSPSSLDDLPDTAPATAPVARSLGPPVDLAVLVRPDAPKRARRKRIDLGHVSRKVDSPAPFVGPDSAPLTLPRVLPRPHLPPDLQRLWDREDATRLELRRALIGQARADRKERACKESACVDLACIGKLKRAFDDEARAVRGRRRDERRELISSLRRHLAGLGDKAPPGVLLALASTLDDVAREAGGDLAPALKEPIVLYERAAALAGPTSDIGWFAHYLRAVALHDTSEDEKAKAAFLALAQASPGGWRAVQAAYEAARLEQDPGRASDGYQRVVNAAEKGSSMRMDALLHWLRSALVAERPADVLHAGDLLCEEVLLRGVDEWEGFLVEASDAMAEALGRLVVSRPIPPLSRAPAAVFASIAARVAANAVRRADFTLAVHTWKAIIAHAPDAKEAAAARAGLAAAPEHGGERSEIEGRLAALLNDCGRAHFITTAPLDLTFTVDAAKVTARPAKPDPSSYFLRCLEARGPAYFADAKADLSVKLTLTNF